MTKLLNPLIAAAFLAAGCTGEEDMQPGSPGPGGAATEADVRTFGLPEEQLNGAAVLDTDNQVIGRVADTYQDLPGRVGYLLVELTLDTPRLVYVPVAELEAATYEGRWAVRTYLEEEEIAELPAHWP
ncbi:MAG: PRC-barrel domain-containing protein [Allosphingosinicella sp.]|uniref:PRC-barrel domain-containing protein n=1 Tax=Allosphingosinicella sp. TaxID=2823234 RepID=UPI00394A5C3F